MVPVKVIVNPGTMHNVNTLTRTVTVTLCKLTPSSPPPLPSPTEAKLEIRSIASKTWLNAETLNYRATCTMLLAQFIHCRRLFCFRSDTAMVLHKSCTHLNCRMVTTCLPGVLRNSDSIASDSSRASCWKATLFLSPNSAENPRDVKFIDTL